MIKYHILSLLALAVIALAGIEAAAEFYEAELKQAGSWYTNGKAWIMVAVVLGATFLYFRSRAFRKKEVMKSKHN
jgi:hypothetical protein